MKESDIQEAALVFVRKHRDHIARELTNIETYIPDEVPVSVFMAGSPGAGKTEFSKALIFILERGRKHRVLRIDTDDYRLKIPGYTGSNSHLFQGAVSLVAERVHDYALANKQSFVFDGTLWRREKAEQNIQRSLNKGRVIFIFYIYQHPQVAWRFTEAREKAEGRKIPKEAFIDQFLGAKDTGGHLAKLFEDKITIVLVKKDFTKHNVESIVEIGQKDTIDSVIHESYTKDELERLL